MFTERFDVSDSYACTLPPESIGTHEDGWTITGEVHKDHYEWVNEFEAVHPVHGKVWGDFEHGVYADSEEGFNHFCEHHPAEDWDYQDI